MCILINNLSSSSRTPDPFFATISEYGVITIIVAVPLYPISLFLLQKGEGIKKELNVLIKALLERIRPESIEILSPNEAIKIEKRATVLHLHDALVYEDDDERYKDDKSDFYNTPASKLYNDAYQSSKSIEDANTIQEIARAHSRAKKRAHESILDAKFVGIGDTEQLLRRAEIIHSDAKPSMESRSSTSQSVCWEEEIFQRGGNHISTGQTKTAPLADDIENLSDIDIIERKSHRSFGFFQMGRFDSPQHRWSSSASSLGREYSRSNTIKSVVERATDAGKFRSANDSATNDLFPVQSHEDILERRSKSMRLNAAVLRAGASRREVLSLQHSAERGASGMAIQSRSGDSSPSKQHFQLNQ